MFGLRIVVPITYNFIKSQKRNFRAIQQATLKMLNFRRLNSKLCCELAKRIIDPETKRMDMDYYFDTYKKDLSFREQLLKALEVFTGESYKAIAGSIDGNHTIKWLKIKIKEWDEWQLENAFVVEYL